MPATLERGLGPNVDHDAAAAAAATIDRQQLAGGEPLVSSDPEVNTADTAVTQVMPDATVSTDPNLSRLLGNRIKDTLKPIPEYEVATHYKGTAQKGDDKPIGKFTPHTPDEARQIFDFGTDTQVMPEAQEDIAGVRALTERFVALDPRPHNEATKAQRKEYGDESTNALLEEYESAIDIAARTELMDMSEKSRFRLGNTKEVQLQTIKARAQAWARHKRGEPSAFADFTKERQGKHPKGKITKVVEAAGKLVVGEQNPNKQTSRDLLNRLSKRKQQAGSNIAHLINLANDYKIDRSLARDAAWEINKLPGKQDSILDISKGKFSPTQKAAYFNAFNELNHTMKSKKAHRAARRFAKRYSGKGIHQPSSDADTTPDNVGTQDLGLHRSERKSTTLPVAELFRVPEFEFPNSSSGPDTPFPKDFGYTHKLTPKTSDEARKLFTFEGGNDSVTSPQLETPAVLPRPGKPELSPKLKLEIRGRINEYFRKEAKASAPKPHDIPRITSESARQVTQEAKDKAAAKAEKTSFKWLKRKINQPQQAPAVSKSVPPSNLASGTINFKRRQSSPEDDLPN